MKTLLLALACLALGACSTGTVTPPLIIATTPSIDPIGQADSGDILIIPNVGRFVTPHWRDRYNALIATYGADPLFLPPLATDMGITAPGQPGYADYLKTALQTVPVNQQAGLSVDLAGSFFVQTRFATDFGLMNEWNKKHTHQPKNALMKALKL